MTLFTALSNKLEQKRRGKVTILYEEPDELPVP